MSSDIVINHRGEGSAVRPTQAARASNLLGSGEYCVCTNALKARYYEFNAVMQHGHVWDELPFHTRGEEMNLNVHFRVNSLGDICTGIVYCDSVLNPASNVPQFVCI